jgi:hypothetical protein
MQYPPERFVATGCKVHNYINWWDYTHSCGEDTFNQKGDCMVNKDIAKGKAK